MILGIDEAGRGPWAGPLVVGAVVLGGLEIDGLDDSKKLTKKKRELLEKEIKQKALGYGLGWVSAQELDEIGMSAALELATKRAVLKIKVPYSEIIIDGTVNFLKNTGKGRFVKTFPKADAIFPSVSAASILAKVGRDRYMTELGKQYPEYGFSSNSGYGTKKHIEAIAKYGIISEHRVSFKPLQKFSELMLNSRQAEKIGSDSQPEKLKVTTKQIGDQAEEVVAQKFLRSGYEIIGRNVKNRFAEIDIIAKNQQELCFIEVRYRKNSQYGSGLESITPKKIKQMRFAAELFLSTQQQFKTQIIKIIGASVSGPDYQIDEIVEIN